MLALEIPGAPSLLLFPEFVDTRQTLLSMSSSLFTSPVFASLSVQQIVFSKY